MKKLKESQSLIIKRSQINLNPCNPKKHDEKAIKRQMQNLKKNGYLGGVQWNMRTGNLIDGHRRVLAMDLYFKYDGSAETDYEIRLEVVDYDPKTEKEQMTYEAAGNTDPDLRAIANYIDDIDVGNLGLDETVLKEIMSLRVDDATPPIETMEDFFNGEELEEELTYEPSYEERKKKIKDAKAQTREKTEREAEDERAYLVLSFSSFENKEAFCEMLGIPSYEQYVKGEELLSKLE